MVSFLAESLVSQKCASSVGRQTFSKGIKLKAAVPRTLSTTRTSGRSVLKVESNKNNKIETLGKTMCQAAATYLAVAGIACAGTIVEASTNPVVSQISDGGLLNGGIAIAGVGAIAALAAILVSSDPSKRREQMSMDAGGDEMESVKNYFNTTGYDRWRKIYGETDDVNKVQLDIRTGHAQTVEKVLAWMRAEGNLKNCTVADCGCGTGSLAIPLALDGAAVHATDISSSMVGEAEMRYKALVADGAQAPEVAPRFEAMDLETASGKYHTVACLDVMIHYPQEKADDMITHLASLAEERVILSFAPKTLALSALKRVGEFFPGPSKATRAYLHREEDVEAALAKAGWKVTNREMTSTQFYYSRLLEAKRV